jgi:predicted nucleotidyltransferase
MDIYKEKFTKLEREIIKFFCVNTGKNYNQREIALALKVSPTAIANSIKNLEKEEIIKLNKNKNTKPQQISLNVQNNSVFFIKRVENLKMIYESGLAEFLFDKFPGASIILFGSYSWGEDNINSDIDIAVVGNLPKKIDLSNYENKLSKKIVIQYFDSFDKINKNLKESILNGILLKGSVRL